MQAGKLSLSEALSQRLAALRRREEQARTDQSVCRAMQADHACYDTLDAEKYWRLLYTPPQAAAAAARTDRQDPCPWRRFLARGLDMLLCSSAVALALMLAVYRNVVPMTLDAMDGTWSRESYAKRSYTVSGKTVGIYGIGNIGRKVAALVKAFGAEVIYYDPFRLPENRERELGVTFVDPDTLLKKADILSLHAPLTEQTRNFICAETLAKMKDGAVLINTAREELVDYAAAAQALRSGKLLGAGFDAIEEDLVRSNPFVGLKNVVLTQHLGGNTTDNAVQMARHIAQQITAVRGKCGLLR